MWPGGTPLPLPAELSPWWLRRSSCSWPTSSYLQGMSSAAGDTALKQQVPSPFHDGVEVSALQLTPAWLIPGACLSYRSSC